MKRDESLAPLSREHHTALILAQLLKKGAPAYKGLPVVLWEKIDYAKNMFQHSIKEHFQKEELLIRKVQHCHEDVEKFGKEIIAEHEHLTESFISLDKLTSTEDTLDALGNALDIHIRKEERILFPLIQKHCSQEELKEIGLFLQ